jgi:hypothetical protein
MIKNFSMLFLALNSFLVHSQMGIGTLTPESSAILELKSNNKGFLLPRMTSDEQALIKPASKGLIIFNTTTNQIENNIGDELDNIIWAGASTKAITAPIGTNTNQIATTEFVIANTGSYNFIKDVGELKTDSKENVIIPNFSVTPPKGNYIITFNSQFNNSDIETPVTGFLEDLLKIYNQLKNTTTPDQPHIAYFLNETLIPGVYNIVSSSTITGNIIFDGLADPNSIFIIKATGSITFAEATKIVLMNGAKAKNIFWITEGAIIAGPKSDIKGVLISNGSEISLGNETNLEGRMFTTSGALAFGSGLATISELNPDYPFGSLSSFIMFTENGDINNSGISTIVGDILSITGTTTSLEAATIIGTNFVPNSANALVIKSINTSISQATFSIFKNGAVIEDSIRNLKNAGLAACINIQSLVTVNEGDIIDVRWKTNYAKLTLGNRTLSLIKVND